MLYNTEYEDITETSHLCPEYGCTPLVVMGAGVDSITYPEGPQQQQPRGVECQQDLRCYGASDGTGHVDVVGHIALILNQWSTANE